MKIEDFQFPSDWKLGPVAESFDFTGKPRGLDLSKNGGEIPFFPMDQIPLGRIHVSQFTPKPLAELGSGTYVENGDLMVAKITPSFENGKQAIVDIETDFAFATTEVIPMRGRKGESDTLFLFFYLLHPEVRSDLAGKMEGSTGRQRLSKTVLGDRMIPLPPLPEQKKIAHILSTVQRAIEAQERIIQTTTELKKALMHKLFTEGLRNEPKKQTEIGPVPESWEVVPLGEFFQIKHGYAFDGKFFKPTGEHILMTPGHFHEEGGFREQGEKTKYFTGEIPQDYVLAKDDIVVAMTEQTAGLLGSAAFVPEGDLYLHNQRLGLIVDLEEKRLSKRFLFYVFNHPHLRVEVAKTSTGSKVKHTSPTKLRAVKVGIPPTLDEQEEIASVLSTTQQKISVATNKKSQLQDLFRTLLHQLMTARIQAGGISHLPGPSI
jgi:type I restriction enzyme S subunit